MNLPQQKFREIVFITLFASMHGVREKRSLEELIMEQLKVSRSNVSKGIEKAKLVESHLKELDEKIREVVHSYDFERIQSVEKTALRLGTYDLFIEKNLSPNIIISEALRLTKKFGTPAATSFVNAILDALYKLGQGESPDTGGVEHSLEVLQASEEYAHEASLTPPQPASE